MPKLKIRHGKDVMAYGSTIDIPGSEIETGNAKEYIERILRNRMSALRRKMTERDLRARGMPMEEEFLKFWSSPMEAVEEVWAKLAKENCWVDSSSFFRIGSNMHSVYGMSRKGDADKEEKQMGNRQGVSKERKEVLADKLADMMKLHKSFPSEPSVISNLTGVGYSELLKAFRSYDGIKTAASKRYWEKYGEEDDKTVEVKQQRKRGRTERPIDELKGALLEYYNSHGRLPTRVECDNDPSLASYNNLLKRLGPKSEWEKSLGIEAASDEAEVEAEAEAAEPEVVEPEPEAEVLKAKKPPKVEICQDAAVTDDLEIQVIVKLPGQKKPLKITISQ
ncbi:hypothetical protein IKD60_01100 [Candidatus Saccharibacteria bacterium]|nr:hypothetical protein [Candidatus Saccharibacteria bacterium]